VTTVQGPERTAIGAILPAAEALPSPWTDGPRPAIILSEPLNGAGGSRSIAVSSPLPHSWAADQRAARVGDSLVLDEAGRVVFSSRPDLSPAFLESARSAAAQQLCSSGRARRRPRVGYGGRCPCAPLRQPALDRPARRTRRQGPGADRSTVQVLPVVSGCRSRLVCLVGAIQIRRRVEPVDVLMTAARRVAGGDLGARATCRRRTSSACSPSPSRDGDQLQRDFEASPPARDRSGRAVVPRSQRDRDQAAAAPPGSSSARASRSRCSTARTANATRW